MASPNAYAYTGMILGFSSTLLFVLFLIVSISNYKYKVYFTQSLLTLSIVLLIISYLAFHGHDQQELNTWLYFFTVLAAVPLIYHLLYYAFFSEDQVTQMKLLKIYVLGGVMLYVALIWSQANRLAKSEPFYTNLTTHLYHSIQILTIGIL